MPEIRNSGAESKSSSIKMPACFGNLKSKAGVGFLIIFQKNVPKMPFHSLKLFSSVCLLALFLLVTGCQKENSTDCFKSTGTVTTLTRSIDPFSEIFIEDNIEVVLVQDTERYLEIKAGENLQSNILTEISGERLTISNINKCNWVRSYRKQIVVTIHTPTLASIRHDGHNTLRTEGEFKTDKLFLHVTGAGDTKLNLTCNYLWMDMYEVGNVELQGSAETLIAEVWGLGKLYGKDFKTNYTNVMVRYGGDATVNAQQGIDALLTNIGNLYYYGKPGYKKIQIAGKGKATAM
ncbi:MAG: DUF2807 domain-containing protein [Hymenobacteraceae bacterium]|nr:DUF2807 domain-containing protein [Hymenobacteraceae bacterium]MDX5396655.1 DUF2807 domain-containing protein [Hymenobacteraceae bacterium]MDX5512721.1 DUF2807 domain-containing protein [Hymenobacteraceae bacterium]